LLVVILVTAGNAVVLMQGKYETGDFYTDNQFETFLTALGTMFIFVVSGENYVEAITASLHDPYAFFYLCFFAICTVLGMFFISALLIEQFQSTFLRQADNKHNEERVRGLLALASTFVIWTRHSIRGQRDMCFPNFADLMLQQGRASPGISTPAWLTILRGRTLALVASITAQPPEPTAPPPELTEEEALEAAQAWGEGEIPLVEVLCHVTAEMHLDEEFEALS
jgi:hypothetical protein